MRFTNLTKSLSLQTLIVCFFLCVSCTGYGEKLEYDGTEVYFTHLIEKQEAEKLGAFLVRSKFTDGNKKSVQLTKSEDTNNYIFRMVAKKETAESDQYDVIFKIMAMQISDSVLNKAPVDFDICDNRFKTLKTISFESRK